MTVPSGDVRIDLADGRPGRDQGVADIEGDGLDVGKGSRFLFHGFRLDWAILAVHGPWPEAAGCAG